MTKFHIFDRKDTSKSKVQRLNESYIIKNDGTVSLDLAKAAKSQSFKEGIRRIRQQDLKLTEPHRG